MVDYHETDMKHVSVSWSLYTAPLPPKSTASAILFTVSFGTDLALQIVHKTTYAPLPHFRTATLHYPHENIMYNCQLEAEVSALRDRTVLDKAGNKRYILSGYKGSIAGWGRGSIDVLWKIPKAFGGFYEVLEVRVKEKDLKINNSIPIA